MPKLKLGPIPDDKPVRLTIVLPAELLRTLEAYAEAHAVESGRRMELRKLVPHMLDAFIRSDRGFAARGKQGAENVFQVQTVSSPATVGVMRLPARSPEGV